MTTAFARRIVTVACTIALAACHHAPPADTAATSASTDGGTIVASNMNDHTATILDARTRAVLATIPTGRGPHEVAISRDGRWALVSNYGNREGAGSTISVIDVDTRSVVRTIDLGEYRRPHGMAFFPGDTMIAVTAEQSKAVLLVDFRTGHVIKAMPTNGRAPHMIGLSADGRRLVTGNLGEATIAIISPLGTDTTRNVKVARQPEGIAITPDGSRAWVGSNQDAMVLIVDLSRGTPIDTVRGFGLPYRMAVSPDGRTAVVTDPVKATVRVFDEPTRRERFTIDIPHDSLVATAEVKESPSPEGLAISRDSRRAFVTLQGRNRVAVIDLDRGTIVGYGVTGNWSDGIGYSPRGR